MRKMAKKVILTSKPLAEQVFTVEVHNTKNSVKAGAHSQKIFLGASNFCTKIVLSRSQLFWKTNKCF